MSDMLGVGTAVNAAEQQAIANGQQQIQQGYINYLQGQQAKIEGLQGPHFNSNPLTPQNYRNPILAQSQGVNISPEDRANQVQALQQLQGVASGAASAQQNAENYGAMQRAAQQQQAANAAITQNLASRGALGSGQELAAKMQAGQNAANQSQAGMLQGAQNAALQRLQATGQYLQGTGQMRGQDTELAAKNADIINQFNMANTASRNHINEANTQLANQYGMYNQQLQNQNAQQAYQDALSQAGMAAGEANNIAGMGFQAANQNAANQSGILGGINSGINSGLQQGYNIGSQYFGQGGGGGGGSYVEQTPGAMTVPDSMGSSFTGAEGTDAAAAGDASADDALALL